MLADDDDVLIIESDVEDDETSKKRAVITISKLKKKKHGKKRQKEARSSDSQAKTATVKAIKGASGAIDSKMQHKNNTPKSFSAFLDNDADNKDNKDNEDDNEDDEDDEDDEDNKDDEDNEQDVFGNEFASIPTRELDTNRILPNDEEPSRILIERNIVARHQRDPTKLGALRLDIFFVTSVLTGVLTGVFFLVPLNEDAIVVRKFRDELFAFPDDLSDIADETERTNANHMRIAWSFYQSLLEHAKTVVPLLTTSTSRFSFIDDMGKDVKKKKVPITINSAI
jgi:hypothetical protein